MTINLSPTRSLWVQVQLMLNPFLAGKVSQQHADGPGFPWATAEFPPNIILAALVKHQSNKQNKYRVAMTSTIWLLAQSLERANAVGRCQYYTSFLQCSYNYSLKGMILIMDFSRIPLRVLRLKWCRPTFTCHYYESVHSSAGYSPCSWLYLLTSLRHRCVKLCPINPLHTATSNLVLTAYLSTVSSSGEPSQWTFLREFFFLSFFHFFLILKCTTISTYVLALASSWSREEVIIRSSPLHVSCWYLSTECTTVPWVTNNRVGEIGRLTPLTCGYFTATQALRKTATSPHPPCSRVWSRMEKTDKDSLKSLGLFGERFSFFGSVFYTSATDWRR